MKKLIISLVLSFPLLAGLASCGTDTPYSSEATYSATFSDVTDDMFDFYDIDVSFVTNFGFQNTYRLNDYRGRFLSGIFSIVHQSSHIGSVTVTTTCKRKTDQIMDDATDYTLGLSCTVGVEVPSKSIAESQSYGLAKETQKGSCWKAREDYEGTATVAALKP